MDSILQQPMFVPSLLSSVVFSFLHLFVPNILNALYPAWWKNLPQKKRDEIPACVAGLFHHFVVAPYGIFMGFQYMYLGRPVIAEEGKVVIPWILGYLVGDTLFYALPLATKGQLEYLIHHILGFWLTYGAFTASSTTIISLFPHFLATEMSTAFFSLGWIARNTSYKQTDMWLINLLENIFVVLFTLTRIINMPYIVVTNWEDLTDVGLARYSLIPIVMLQFYWFYKIIRTIIGSGKKEKEREM